MPVESTRQLILDKLRELQTAEPSDLAARLGMTSAGIRYHLARLVAEGLVEEGPHPSPPGLHERGRPARRFRLSIQHKPDNLAGLCTALLRAISTGEMEWERLAAEMVALPAVASSLQRRLAAAVIQLNGLNYQANWEAGPSGPRLRLNNCPYAKIWASAPDLCRLDEALLNRLTQAAVRQVARTGFGGAGPASCLFDVREKQAEPRPYN